MNTDQRMSIPPPYTAKTDQPLPTDYYQEISYPEPPVQQRQRTSNTNSLVMTTNDLPMSCTCPYCHQSIITKIKKDSGVAVWLSSAFICVFGCFCGCCLIPFCIDALKDTIHYCPLCHRAIAHNRKL